MIIDADGRVWICRGASREEIVATVALWRSRGIDVRMKPDDPPKSSRMRKPSTWDREAAARYESGLSIQHVARQMVCGVDKVRAALRRCGVEARKTGPSRSSDERTKSMIERYQSGATLQQIGDEHHISSERVRYLLVRAGFDPLPSGWRKIEKRRERDAEIKRLVESGETVSDIAAAFGMHADSVSKAYRRLGIEPPPRVGRKKTRTKRALAMFDAGASLDEIVKGLGYKNKATVSAFLHRYGRTLERREMAKAQEAQA